MTDNIADKILAANNIDKPNDTLAHYGVKGMRWGVTRVRGANGRVTREVSDDHVQSRTIARKRPSQMSNSELKRVNERLQLEQTNKRLQSRGVLEKVKTGTAIAGTILAVGTTMSTAYNFYQSPVGQKIANSVKKKFLND